VASGDLVLAQINTLIVSTDTEECSIIASVEGTLVTRPTLEVITTQDSARTSISEAPVVISVMKEILV